MAFVFIGGRDRTPDVDLTGVKSGSTISGSPLQIQRTAGDPIAQTQFNLIERESPTTIAERQLVIILDDTLASHPAHNLLVNPNFTGGGASPHVAQTLGGASTSIATNDIQMSVSNASTGENSFSQTTQAQLTVPAQSYMYSINLDITSDFTGGYAFIRLKYLDAGSNVIGGTTVEQDYTTTGGVTQRIFIQGDAPSGAAFAEVTFGIVTTSGTNSGAATFSDQQLEPMFLAGYPYSYPSPAIATDPNAYTLPDGTIVRQNRKFAGFITDIEGDDFLGGVGAGGERMLQITASSPACLFESTGVNVNYQNMLDLDIIDSLLATYFPNSIKRYNNAVAGVTLDQLILEGTARDVMNALTGNSNYVWYVDPYFELHYKWLGYHSAPYALSSDTNAIDYISVVPFFAYKNNRDGTQIANRVTVTGGNFGVGTPPDNFTGDGSTKDFTLSAQPYSMISITVNGTAQRLGISGVSASGSYDVSWSNSSQTISFVSAPAAAAAIAVTYLKTAVVKVRVTDAQSVSFYKSSLHSGIFDRFLSDSSLVTIAGAVQRAIAELIQFSYGQKTIQVYTEYEVKPTAMVPLTAPWDGYNNTPVLCQSSTVYYRGVNELLQEIWEYQLQLGAYNKQLTNILNSIQRQGQQTSSQPIAPVLEEHAAVIEVFSVTDGGVTGH